MRLTDLLHVDVVDEDGTKLGMLTDLRRHRPAPGSRTRVDAQLDTLVFAQPGHLEHIGIRQASTCTAAWKDVLRIERNRIVIRCNKYHRAR